MAMVRTCPLPAPSLLSGMTQLLMKPSSSVWIVQKWIALFPNGQEGWSEIRRTGYPKVFALPVSTNGYTIHVANRIPYDVNERTRNQANYNAALVTLGGADDYATKLWWQKK